jgi:5-methylcytosine-specific restriction endonuclease McrA
MIAADRARKAEHDKNRPTARQRGYDTAWEKARRGFLAKHPHCARCGAPATVINHRTPHRGNRLIFWDRNNWEPVCAPCHNSVIQSEERRAQ